MKRLIQHMFPAVLALVFGATFATADQSTRQTTKLASGQAAAGWQAVGRLEIVNLAYCTGVLIAPDVVMTAAHCLFDPRSRTTVAPSDVRFQADLRNGRASATLQAAAYVIHPEFDYDGDTQAARVTKDLALVRLRTPAPGKLTPFSTGERPKKGSDVAIVSYGQGRDDTPVLEEGCSVLARRSGMLVLNCSVEFGSSGAPVFQKDLAGQVHVVSVVSSAVDLRGTRYALGTDLKQPLAKLTTMLNDLPPQTAADMRTAPDAGLPKVRVLGQSQGGGAKFVRP